MSRRQNNLLTLVERYDSQAAFARVTGLDPAVVSGMLAGSRAIGNIRARRIEAALELESGWLDRNYDNAASRWHDYMRAGLASGLTAPEAESRADGALDAYVNRWD